MFDPGTSRTRDPASAEGACVPLADRNSQLRDVACDKRMSPLVVSLSPLVASFLGRRGLTLAMADDGHRRGPRNHHER
jgi:hypothetical protein